MTTKIGQLSCIAIILIQIIALLYLEINCFPPTHSGLVDPKFFKKIRLFDLTLYNGESEMLYTRLWRMTPYVDHFLIFVSQQSFSGLQRNVSFAPFDKEIRAFPNLHLYYDDIDCKSGGAWCREKKTRTLLMNHLSEFKPNSDDLVLSSDIDEIPTRKGIEFLLNNPPKTIYDLKGAYLSPNYKFFMFDWYRAILFRYSKDFPIDDMRRGEKMFYKFPDFYVLTHCSWCFRDIEQARFKILSYSHQEHNRYPFHNKSYIFRQHYCRRSFCMNYNSVPTSLFEGEEIIPDDPRLNYLIDKNFMFDITQTIYSEKDLDTLCNPENDFWIEFDKRLKPKFYENGKDYMR